MSASEPEVGPDGQPARRSFSAAGEASSVQTAIIAFICFVLLAGTGTMVYYRIFHKPVHGSASTDRQLHDHNLSFEPPSAPWTADADTRAKLGPPMILAFKRAEPDAYIAIGARNFETREPRVSELRDGFNRVLAEGGLFADVERTQRPDETFLGLPARVAFTFTARSKEGPILAGFCFATSYKGIGYWFISWAGQTDAAEQEATFAEIRDHLKLEQNREKWTPSEQPIRSMGGHALGYHVLDGEDIWKEPEPKDRPATGEDPKGDLLLIAKIKARGKDMADEATLVAMILDADGADPLAQGRKYVESQRTAQVKMADNTLEPSFKERVGEPEGDPPSNPIETPTPIVRLQMTVKGASNFSRLIVVSAIKIGNQVVVVEAWCAWGDREAFEAKLMQIAGSLAESQ